MENKGKPSSFLWDLFCYTSSVRKACGNTTRKPEHPRKDCGKPRTDTLTIQWNKKTAGKTHTWVSFQRFSARRPFYVQLRGPPHTQSCQKNHWKPHPKRKQLRIKILSLTLLPRVKKFANSDYIYWFYTENCIIYIHVYVQSVAQRYRRPKLYHDVHLFAFLDHSLASRPPQLKSYKVFHGEFESDLPNPRILRPDEKIEVDVCVFNLNIKKLGISLADRS